MQKLCSSQPQASEIPWKLHCTPKKHYFVLVTDCPVLSVDHVHTVFCYLKEEGKKFLSCEWVFYLPKPIPLFLSHSPQWLLNHNTGWAKAKGVIWALSATLALTNPSCHVRGLTLVTEYSWAVCGHCTNREPVTIKLQCWASICVMIWDLS